MAIVRSDAFWRVLATLSAIFVIGLPILTVWQTVLLMLFVLAIFNAKPVLLKNIKRSLWVLLGCSLLITINYLVPQPNIPEASNVYVPAVKGSLRQHGFLPTNVSSYLKSAFNQYYPADYIDKNPKSSPWQKVLLQTNHGAAFSAELPLAKQGITRNVQAITFNGYKGLRAGFINDNSQSLGVYNFYYENNKNFLTRGHLPFFVNYTLPSKLAGSELCWQGSVFLASGSGYAHVNHSSYSCQSLSWQNLPLIVVGVSFPQHESLVMKLVLSSYWQVLAAIKIALPIVSLCLLLFLFKLDFKQFTLSGLFLGVVLLAISSMSGHLTQFADTPIIEGGSDGLIYQGFGREILYHLVHGNFSLALRGGVDIFYYMPGMRYICALQSWLFGDTILGFLVLAVALVFALKHLCFSLFKRSYAWFFIVFFLLASLKTFTKYAIGFNAEIAGYCLLAVGVVNLLRAASKKSLLNLSLAAFLFALAVIIRPNFLIGVVIGLLFSAWGLLKHKSWWQVLVCLLPFNLIGLVLLHNFYFGHQIVLFTSSALIPHNLILTPKVYWQAFVGLCSGSINVQAHAVFYHLFHDWLNNGVFLLPLILVMVQTFQRGLSGQRRTLLLLMAGLQIPCLFWAAGNRYTSFVWVLSYFIALEMIFNWVVSLVCRGIVKYHNLDLKEKKYG